MDGFLIPASHTEEAITDEMLDEIAAELERHVGPATDAIHLEHPYAQEAQQRQSGSNDMNRCATPDEQAAAGADTNDALDDITSDDSGDFVFFTSGVTNADIYDRVRDFIAYTKQQERELEELDALCEALEDEQRNLWTHAVSATHAERQPQASDADREPTPSNALTSSTVFDPNQPALEWVDPVVDEFDDLGLTSTRTCVYMDPKSSAMRRDPFRYSTPSLNVAGASFSNVFKTGFLFMAEAPDGSWVFFNDSEKYKMSVKYVFGEQSVLTPGPHARMQVLPNGEREVAVTVMPEETEVLVRGTVNGFRNCSVAEPIDGSFVNEHVQAHQRDVEAQLATLAARLKKASASFVTPEEALAVAAETGAFIDPSFPPLTSSIHRPGLDEVFLWALPWRRPAEYLTDEEDANEVRLFRGHVHPIDASPGDGGDYYLCSAASIAAEFPMKIRALFRHPVSVQAGKAERRLHAYRVTLNRGGWWHTFVLDDYLPASKKGPDYGRCQHDLRKLWYPLLEKAYAKAHNSYAAIQFGDPLEALQDLLGFPTCRFDEEWAALVASSSDDDADNAEATNRPSRHLDGVAESVDKAARDALFAQMADHLARGYVVVLSTPEEGPVEAMRSAMGFAYGMSYALLRVVREGDELLVQVRCPTMTPTWEGRWCPGSASWESHPSLKTACGMDDDEVVYDAMWLDWSETLQLFDGGGVCYTRFAYEDYRVRGHFAPEVGPSVALEVYVKGPAPMEAYCVLSQEDDRGTAESSPNHSLNPLMLMVTEAKSDHVQRINAVCSPDPDHPAEQLNFVLGRDVAMVYRFEPSSQPYYIIPRARAITTMKTFTLGLLTDSIVDDDNVSVRCVALREDSPILRNKREFRPSDVVPGKPTTIQHRRPDGTLHEHTGTSLASPTR